MGSLALTLAAPLGVAEAALVAVREALDEVEAAAAPLEDCESI